MKSSDRISLFFKKRKKNKLAIEMLGIGLFVTLAIVLARYEDIKGGFFEIDYRTAEGVVTKSEIVYKSGYRRSGYHYVVLYQYSVDGILLETEGIDFSGTGKGTKQKAQDVADRYPVGSKVKVYYQIGNAGFSVLEPQVNSNVVFILVFVFICLPFLMIGFFLYKKKSSPKESAIKASLKKRK